MYQGSLCHERDCFSRAIGYSRPVQTDGSPAGCYSLWMKASDHDSEWIREVVVEHGKTTHHDVRLEKSGPLPLTSGAAD